MALTTVEILEQYLGVIFDSAETVMYQTIIDAVDSYVSQYTGQNFDDDVYSQRIGITDGQFNICNTLQYFYGVSYGIAEVISVTTTSNNASIQVSEDGETLSLINGFSKTDIDISGSTLSATVTAISNEAGWTATLGTSVDDNYAKVIYAGNYASIDNDVSILGAPNKTSVSQLSDRLFQAGVQCAEGMAIFQGGFPVDSNGDSIVPSDLQDMATRFVIESYGSKNPTTISGDLKKEKIGDYEYEVLTASELSSSIDSIAINYKDVLDFYKCINI